MGVWQREEPELFWPWNEGVQGKDAQVAVQWARNPVCVHIHYSTKLCSNRVPLPWITCNRLSSIKGSQSASDGEWDFPSYLFFLLWFIFPTLLPLFCSDKWWRCARRSVRGATEVLNWMCEVPIFWRGWCSPGNKSYKLAVQEGWLEILSKGRCWGGQVLQPDCLVPALALLLSCQVSSGNLSILSALLSSSVEWVQS